MTFLGACLAAATSYAGDRAWTEQVQRSYVAPVIPSNEDYGLGSVFKDKKVALQDRVEFEGDEDAFPGCFQNYKGGFEVEERALPSAETESVREVRAGITSEGATKMFGVAPPSEVHFGGKRTIYTQIVDAKIQWFEAQVPMSPGSRTCPIDFESRGSRHLYVIQAVVVAETTKRFCSERDMSGSIMVFEAGSREASWCTESSDEQAPLYVRVARLPFVRDGSLDSLPYTATRWKKTGDLERGSAL